MAEPYLAPHPWDSIGKPPEPGKPYVEPETREATADVRGFTDSTGRHMSWADGVRAAAECIMDQGERGVVEELIDAHMSPEEILVWLVDPDTERVRG